MLRRVLVCYDIPDTKRRTKIYDKLSEYGIRANYSVFELTISDTKLKKLESELLALIKPKSDSLRVYYICENCLMKSHVLGAEAEPFMPSNSVVL
jgi:CRISPR-associated protein Cas2